MQQAAWEIEAETRTVQRELRAIAEATEYGMVRAVMIKRLQNDLEKLCPDAAEVLAFMANTGALNLVQRVQRFGNEVG